MLYRQRHARMRAYSAPGGGFHHGDEGSTACTLAHLVLLRGCGTLGSTVVHCAVGTLTALWVIHTASSTDGSLTAREVAADAH